MEFAFAEIGVDQQVVCGKHEKIGIDLRQELPGVRNEAVKRVRAAIDGEYVRIVYLFKWHEKDHPSKPAGIDLPELADTAGIGMIEDDDETASA